MLTIITLAAIFSPLAILTAGIIGGIIKYIASPRTTAPPAQSADFAAWDEVTQAERKKAQERDYYAALIANLEDLQRIAERGERDEKQLRKIISIDKQIHAAQLKLEKLG